MRKLNPNLPLTVLKNISITLFDHLGNHFISDRFGIKLLTKIRVDYSDLREDKFYHNFNGKNSVCCCGLDDETLAHFFLPSLMFALEDTTLSKISDKVHSDIPVLPDDHLTHILP